MSGRIHVRPPGRPRRRPGPRRASAHLTPGRALAALVVLATAGAAWGVAASPAFALHAVEITGAALTPTAAVDEAVGTALGDGTRNSFTVRTDEVRDRLLALPTVAGADVRVTLPGQLRVVLTEREPILVWAAGPARYLVDRDGLVLLDAAAPDATDAARALAAALPVVVDRRTSRWPLADDWRPAVSQALRVGRLLQPLELAIARQLLSLRPADVGSTAAALDVAIDDADGWTIRPHGKASWTAVFGFYSTTLRPPDLVASQVRNLRSLILGHETAYTRIVLADDKNGTFAQRVGASPRPSAKASPRPSAKAATTASPAPSAKASAKPSPRATPTPTPRPTATRKPKPTPTPTPRPTATRKPKPTPTPTPRPAATPTPAEGP